MIRKGVFNGISIELTNVHIYFIYLGGALNMEKRRNSLWLAVSNLLSKYFLVNKDKIN